MYIVRGPLLSGKGVAMEEDFDYYFMFGSNLFKLRVGSMNDTGIVTVECEKKGRKMN